MTSGMMSSGSMMAAPTLPPAAEAPAMGGMPPSLAINELATGAAASLGLDGSAASFAGQMATQAAGKAFEDMSKAFPGSRLTTLRYYFDVNNAYVLQKLQILMLPYRHKDWERRTVAAAGGTYAPRPPSEDPNAPDLYLPLMSYVTYILVAGFVSGADGRFTPEVLASTASTGLVIVCLEVGTIKLALYLLHAGGSAALTWFDLTALSGYKFLAAVLVVLVKALIGPYAGYAAIALLGGNIGTFMAKTMHQSLVDSSGFTPGFMTDGMGSPGRSEKKRKQWYSLLALAMLQPLFFFYLSRV